MLSTTNATTQETDCRTEWETHIGLIGRKYEIVALFLRILTGTLAFIGVLIEVYSVV